MRKWLPDWFAETNSQSKGDLWAAGILSTAVVMLGLMYTTAQHKKAVALAQKARVVVQNQAGNHLAGSTSPYLLQHLHNPVDWYPWGPEALSKARKLNRPIFLSVGYSACHWCHVMEHEDFEDPAIAKILNENFVCIKVDREERPDIDDQYQLAVQIITGSGGWPMSVWLTPDLKPFHAGTYIPPTEFTSLLQEISKLWAQKPTTILSQSNKVASLMQKAAGASIDGALAAIPGDTGIRAANALMDGFDTINKGFGNKPKFPDVPRLKLLLAQFTATKKSTELEAVQSTLIAMSSGGLRDHIGGGFFRYCTDARWQTPHFEKMLADQALNADLCFDACAIKRDQGLLDAGEAALDFAISGMADPATGGFYTSVDADSEGEEGKYYLWTRRQVLENLGKADGELFADTYGISDYGNFRDELCVPQLKRMLLPEELKRLDPLRIRLLQVRNGRNHPAIDDKEVCGLNGRMIGALANAYKSTGEARFLAASTRCADFAINRLIKKDGSLHRYLRQGVASETDGFLDDYAYLAHGLLQLYDATTDSKWYLASERVINQMIKLFWRRSDGFTGFVSISKEATPISKMMQGEDNASPSAVGIAAMDLLDLSRIKGSQITISVAARDRLRLQSAQTVQAFHEGIIRSPSSFCTLVIVSEQLKGISPQ